MGAASKTVDRTDADGDPYLTVKDAAIRLGMSRHMVLKLAAKGELQTAMVTKRLVITRASVERLLAQPA